MPNFESRHQIESSKHLQELPQHRGDHQREPTVPLWDQQSWTSGASRIDHVIVNCRCSPLIVICSACTRLKLSSRVFYVGPLADCDRRSVRKLSDIFESQQEELHCALKLKNFNDEINNFFMNGYCSKIRNYVKLIRKV